FLGSKNRHKLAGFHEGDARGKSECFVKIVRDKEYGFLQTLLQRLEFSLQLISGERIESTKGFIHEQDRRIGSQSSRDANSLALPARELMRVTRSDLRIETDQPQQL